MINAVTLLNRKPGMSVAAFQQYWRSEHARVIARLPGVERYVQSHPLAETYQGTHPVYDGIAELWARDSQAFREIGKSQAYIAVQSDEEQFLDPAKTALVLTDEHVIKVGQVTSDGVKCVRLLKRRKDMSVDEFQSYWRERYGPQIAALPLVERYVQCHARLGGYSGGRQPACDGFDISWFASPAAFREAMNSAAYDRAHGGESNFLADEECAHILAREDVIIA